MIGAVLLGFAGCASAPVKETAPPIFWPQPPDAPRITFVQSLSEPKDIGIKPSWFKKVMRFLFGPEDVPHVVRPSGIAVDEEGGIYIADTGVQVVHYFNASPPTYRQLFNVGPAGRLQNPIGVAVDGAKNVYVSDSTLNRIFVFDPKGKFLRAIGNDEALHRISGIAIDRAREILYAVDTLGHQVVRYSFSGEKKGVIGKRGVADGEFNFPTYAAVDAEGVLYISDSLNFRVQAFDPEGNYQAQMGSLGSSLGQFSRPKGVAVDGASHVYVVDTLFDNVQIFNPSGELLLHFGKAGAEPGSFWLPAGIAIDRKGRIYVADSYNERVQVFQLLEDQAPLPAPPS